MPEAYEEIVADLRRRLADGTWRPGDRLPSERELSRRYAGRTAAVRRALRALAAEGLVERRRGRGTVVRSPRRTARRTNERHQWEKDRARAPREVRRRTGATEHDTGLTAADLVFDVRYREVGADDDLAAAFAVPAGTRLLERVYRTRYAREAAPFNVSRSYLVRAHVAGNPDLLDERNEPWPGGTQHQLRTVGIEVDRVVERVTAARPPTREEAGLLGMPPGTAVVVLRAALIDTAGRVVEVADVTLPGDRTELTFVTPLRRWAD